MSEDGSSRTTDERSSAAKLEPQGISAPVKQGQRYVLGGMLGRGGMGEVLEAYDEQIGRDVAVKRLRTPSPSEKQIARFMREARIQGRLEHPAIVPVHELAIGSDGKPYFAMKKLAGTTLADILKSMAKAPEPGARESTTVLRRYPRQRLLRAIADVCLAVELAHTRGFVHRDLKPENIVLGEFGETYVLDWGVAKVTGEDDSALVISIDTSELVTAAGAAVGTPGYMAPEQARALPDIDARADVYSLGCILFEILAGEPLHPKGAAGMTSAVKGIDGRPSHRAPALDIPPELDDLCDLATRLAPEDRIATARELGERIQQFLDGDRDLERRKELARTHLAAANAAFAREDRHHAMREAGRALALDPTLHAASALITRMIIEPPTTLPDEVRKQFDAESIDVIRRTINVGMMASASYLLFVPILGLVGRVPVHLLATIAGASAASIGMLWWMRRPGSRLFVAPLIVMQFVLIATCARMYTPFLLGPALAAVTAVALMTGPQYAKRQATLVAVVAILAVMAPAIAEELGWLAPTIEIAEGVATIRTWAIQGHTTFFLLMSAYTIAVVTAAVVVVRGLRQAERRARRHMHVQAWQLRQLVAED
ncbi:MAG: serine/threonine-protein kinase [Kofleriaceae bacterium]